MCDLCLEVKIYIYSMRTEDLNLYLLDMSQLCYYYINPQFSPRGNRILISTLKESRLNPLTIGPSPVQVSHLLQPTTKRLHYFYANRAKI